PDRRPRRATLRILHQESTARVGVADAFDGNDHAIAHAGLRAKGSFQVLGINIESGWGNDDVFLAPAETQIALGVEFAQIARTQPALLSRGPNSSLFPVTAGNIFVAHENFAVFGKLAFPA